jgi:probable HAF family extracellular repeat protein
MHTYGFVSKIIFATLVTAICGRAALAGTFTKIDMPGAGETVPFGINTAGDIVGYYAVTMESQFQGFLYRNGIFTTINVPGATSTLVYGINDLGQMVGKYSIDKDPAHDRGFVYDGQTFTPVQYPGSLATVAMGINDLGQIVGSAGYDHEHAFLLDNGVYIDIHPPHSSFATFATGINNLGDIVGDRYQQFGPKGCQGFEYTQGIYKMIDVPGSKMSCPVGVNDNGEISGEDDSGAFLRNTAQQYHQVLNVPGSVATFAGGINASGALVGFYSQGKATAFHGFLWTP